MNSQEHVEFLDRYYSKVRGIYDATRKYYLLGRDALLQEIVAQEPDSVVEIGCGTGRNLLRLKRELPAARFAAVEPCRIMREYALRRCPWLGMSARVVEETDFEALSRPAPDVIFFSYTLSMVQNKTRAVDVCLDALRPGGRLYVLDFGDLEGVAPVGRRAFQGWLHRFHVAPNELEGTWARADAVTRGPLSYWKRARFGPRSEKAEQEG